MKDRTLVLLIIIEILITIGTVLNDIEGQKYIEQQIEDARNQRASDNVFLLFPQEEETVLKCDNGNNDKYKTCIQTYRDILRDFFGYKLQYDDSYISDTYIKKQQGLL